MSNPQKPQRITLTVVVDYCTDSVEPDELALRLEEIGQRAVAGMLTNDIPAAVDGFAVGTQIHENDPGMLRVSVDGGLTYTEAKNWVSVLYEGDPGDNESIGQLRINVTKQGVVRYSRRR